MLCYITNDEREAADKHVLAFHGLKFSAMIAVWVKVRGDNDTVGELAASERCLGLLAFNDRVKLHENLQIGKVTCERFKQMLNSVHKVSTR